MNPSENQIEQMLRQAPRPQPPPGLGQRLKEQIELAPLPRVAASTPDVGLGWFHRWRLAVAGCALAVAGLAVLGFQQVRIHELEDTLQQLREEIEKTPAPPASAAQSGLASSAGTESSSGNTRAELERMLAVVAELSGDVEILENLRAETVELKARIAAQAARVATPQEIQAMSDLRDKAQSIACVNHMKQLGLAGRIWATDNGDILPPDILSMSNELSTPKILVCPADTGRTAAPSWESFTLANSSYEFLAPSGSETEPQRLMFKCPVHGHITLCDGSVQQSLALTHPDRLKRLPDGRVYLDALPTSEPSDEIKRLMMERYGVIPAGAAPPPQSQMSEEMMRRYGLLPADADAQPPDPAAPPDDPP